MVDCGFVEGLVGRGLKGGGFEHGLETGCGKGFGIYVGTGVEVGVCVGGCLGGCASRCLGGCEGVCWSRGVGVWVCGGALRESFGWAVFIEYHEGRIGVAILEDSFAEKVFEDALQMRSWHVGCEVIQ